MKGKNFQVLLLLLLMSINFAFAQGIISTSFNATEDAYTMSTTAYEGLNFGSSEALTLDGVLISSRPMVRAAARSFLKFDLSTIPSNAIITSATLRLSARGTEGIAAANSTELYVDLVNTDWAESTITHNSGISNNTIAATVTISNSVSYPVSGGTLLYRVFDVKNQVQALVEQRIPNYGWRIRRDVEGGLQLTATYHSSETTTTPTNNYVPKLDVSYYIPMSVSSAMIVQASTTTSTDGSISPVIVNGSSSTKSYQWFNSTNLTTPIATTTNLSSVKYGWYGLKVTGTEPGDIMFYGFIVGVKCTTFSIIFNPNNSDYIDDATYSDRIAGSGTTALFNTQLNNGNDVSLISAEQQFNQFESLLRFRLWFDPNLSFNVANLTLYGNAHNPADRANTSNLKLVNAPWAEMSVAYTNKPASLSSPSVGVPSVGAGNTNVTVNIANLVNNWKLNNTQNYGCHLQLISYMGTNTLMQFHSSDATSGSKPTLNMNITSNDCSTNQNLYYVPKETVGPDIADLPADRKLKIRYKDYFDTDNNLNYSIKCLNDDSSVAGPSVTKTDYTNWIVINLSSAGLIANNIYLLELTDSSGKKEYLKFKVI
ncbi:DNRLRE domain-containing protein [Fluviicola sp.]|uniref:DNRLRE domain-containing protein n=1 Tax=Fluviicola sp. TaxID=1917219 RepID=UPI00260721F6|nr:DNRLRE domain-containing protein [Fluviicola sp.]